MTTAERKNFAASEPPQGLVRWALPVLKAFSFFVLFLVVTSFVLAVLGKLAWFAFWTTAAMAALCAYVLPRVRKVVEKY